MSAKRTNPRAGPNAPHPGPTTDATPATGRATVPIDPPAAGLRLPAEWIRERGLPVGGPFEVEELADGALLLRPALGPDGGASFTLPASAERPSEHLFRELVAAYLGGAREFSLVEPGGLRPETRQVARAFAERTGGARIVSDDGEVLVLQEPADGAVPPLPELLQRMYRAVREIQETAGSFLDPDGPTDPSGLAGRDDAVDRQAWLVERTLVLRTSGGWRGARDPADAADPISSILIARALERTADHAVVLGEHAARLAQCSIPDAVRSSLRTYHRQALDYLENAFAVAESPDGRRANELLDTGAALHAAHRSLSESFLVRGSPDELSPLASADLGLVLQSLDRTVAYSEDLAEVALDRAVATQLAIADASGPARAPRSTPRPAHRTSATRAVAALP
ncbi:MAG: hypothetical protein L3K06_00105 [Thermoplasmata archaeon]|nr:hypothetical protein [Thermoplasmata archaeon]